MSTSKGTIAILSLGDMGVGIGKLLASHSYKVITNVSGRSEWTVQRARKACIELVPSDTDLVQQADFLISTVPPRDSTLIATRVKDALQALSPARSVPLYFLELNAVSPATVEKCASILSDQAVCFVDGGIIGGPPRLKEDQTWYRPSIPVAGPHRLPEDIATVLNSRHISDEVGKASGLKICFASLTKGFQALAIQSFTSAETMGILPELRSELQGAGPSVAALGEFAQKGLISLPPKAYRWVKEMDEIADTFSAAGFGQEEDYRGGTLFNSVGEVYRFVAEDTNCGKEKTEDRKTTTADEVVTDLAQSLKRYDTCGK